MKNALLVVSLLLLAGCGGFSGKQSTIVEVSDKEEVTDCKFLQSFAGPSGYRMWGNPAVIGDFKKEAIQKAEKIGATHIIWRDEPTNLGETSFVDAYQCPVSTENRGNKEENSEEN
ncbi:MAG TPA: hypothetical protein VFG19_11170 [Geobacteraceae bacterium]|nr:hypothetical protein [Geobacteraceae bacterium]